MKQTIVIALIISVALIISAYLIAIHQRYGLVTATNSNTNNMATYKIDKLTGKVWWIIDNAQIAIRDKP